jgi:hypothetical protein
LIILFIAASLFTNLLILTEKILHLEALFRRGNLNDEEYMDAKLRLERGETREKPQHEPFNFFKVLSTLGSDLNHMISDPAGKEEALRKRDSKLQSREELQEEGACMGLVLL